MKTAMRVAATNESCNLHEAELALAVPEGVAREKFEALLGFVRDEGQELELHEVERGLFVRLLSLGRSLLETMLAEKGTGRERAGSTVRSPNGAELPYHSTKTRKGYLSIFGEVAIRRAYYWREGASEGCYPLDAELNLPRQRYSYLLQEWAEHLGVGSSYERVTERLDTLLGVTFWNQGLQSVAKSAAGDVQAFYEQKEVPDEETEGELLVATIDGKGVPIRSEEPRGQKLRLRKGEKPSKKKEAVVSAVYTVDRYLRTPEEVVREIDDDNRIVKPSDPPPPRPRPQNKYLRASMYGKDESFAELCRELERRDPGGQKQRVAITDGAASLQKRVLAELDGGSGIVLILDIMHVLTYLWPLANADHEEGSPEASRWVMRKLQLLLEGKVGYVIGGLRSRLAHGGLSRRRQKDFRKAILYMDRNRDYMAYDVYLDNGYPIATGVVEGACKHLVKDRMECTGMRWSVDGAQAILELRAVDLNGDWQAFWRHHVAQERHRLYGSTCSKTSRNAA